ncbi:hypothetical protein PR048_013694 [Dryococelus australis]|uniref:DUF7869 domain-containing protein n=1 Tax=Dryococelus australis TaxID=614101 RepID=A0ABQ9HSX0_9NEOP|nr:hypothetical protein PR048_013694 [Dryococelus australis]
MTRQGHTELVQVCKKYFRSILGISEKKIQWMCSRHFKTVLQTSENREGDHKSHHFAEKRTAVKSFIEILVPLEKHYLRASKADGAKGSSQILSAVYHRLNSMSFEGSSTVRLFVDGCGGQNKNSAMLCMLMYWLENCASSHVNEVHIIFPVPGHSYIPPDRVFERIECELSDMDTIIEPGTYWEIFCNHGTVFKIGDDWTVYDWKLVSQQSLKKSGQWHFKFATAKRFIISQS